MNRGVGNTQLTGNLGNRRPTGLSESHRLPLKLLRVGLFLHALCSPSGRVYPQFLLLHKSGETSGSSLSEMRSMESLGLE